MMRDGSGCGRAASIHGQLEAALSLAQAGGVLKQSDGSIVALVSVKSRVQ